MDEHLVQHSSYVRVFCFGLMVVLAIAPTLASAFSIERLGGEVYNDFVVGPGKVELTLEPGESRAVDLKITNRMGDARTFQLQTEDFSGSDDPSQTVLLLGDEQGPYTLRDFLIPEQSSFVLNNGERATVRVTVSVPLDAEPGGRYGSVLVGTANSPSTGTGGVASGAAIISRIGVLFFVTVPGEVKREGAITKFDTTSGTHFFWNTAPISFSMLYENRGSVHVNPYGAITVTNLSGETVADITVDPWFALPSATRRRDVIWNQGFMFGRYVATADINRGYSNVIDTATVVVWVVPWKIAVGVFGALILVIGMVRFIRSRFEITLKKKRK